MSPAAVAGRRFGARSLAILCVLALVISGAAWWVFSNAAERKITAYFSAAVGVYPGGDVRMLGVPIGSIDTVQPQGETVKVTFDLENDVEVPADANALVVTPSVVADRYVQLAPVYKGGPQMQNGATIPKERTATPVELDQVYKSLNDLSTALGPEGANKDGALSELLDTSAQNLKGNGKALSDMLQNLGDAGKTLSGNSKELFATVENLQKFTTMLAENDAKVREFNTQMQDVSSLLAGEREDLGAALAELAVALDKVESFIRDNREALKSNVDKLTSVSQVLVDQKAALAKSLDHAPVALGNLQNAYNASSGTLDTRAVMNQMAQPPLVSVCQLVKDKQEKQGIPFPEQLLGPCGKVDELLSQGKPLTPDLLGGQGAPGDSGTQSAPALPLDGLTKLGGGQ
ncbi:MCE family protein [Allosaccharopolyspora coralli]|uniref:MCE family protein n=1 Tax=Allosaccharopolyspora coralli TaxID=2665642 RepID=A0A5Q3QAF9_9PSEU|nr:MCE family protein [Allosaccharopolyspora coralli]QGK71548.1 MCE family protein [Allosaccharopolyspora coralli]